MSLTLFYRPLAQAEFEEATEWYENASAGTGGRFNDAVKDVIDEAMAHPKQFAVAEADVHEAAVRGFPYCVYYRVRGNSFIILAVYHQSRDPAGWRARI